MELFYVSALLFDFNFKCTILPPLIKIKKNGHSGHNFKKAGMHLQSAFHKSLNVGKMGSLYKLEINQRWHLR